MSDYLFKADIHLLVPVSSYGNPCVLFLVSPIIVQPWSPAAEPF